MKEKKLEKKLEKTCKNENSLNKRNIKQTNTKKKIKYKIRVLVKQINR
jgi:hypothetical protein